MKILIVDDSNTVRRVLTSGLKKLGYNDIIQASGGLEALKELNKHMDIDMVITDMLMPVIDGIDLSEKIRNIKRFKKTPIIMLTSSNNREKVMKAKSAGITSYVVKPIDMDILKEKIDQAIENKDDIWRTIKNYQ